MKQISGLVFMLIVTVISYAQNLTSLPLSSPIPLANIKMKDVTGKEISLEESKKKNGLLVMFSCNTCPYVIKNQERTKEVAAYALKKDMGVVIINSNEAQRDEEDSFEAMKTYAEAQQYEWPYVVDTASQMANAFGATRTPEVFLFDKKGKLVYKGAMDDNPQDAQQVKRKHLKMAIDELVDGKEVTTKESRSVGCTIKRVE